MHHHDEFPSDHRANSLSSSEEDKNPLSNNPNVFSLTIEDKMRHFPNNSDPKFFPELMTTYYQTKGPERSLEPDLREPKKDFLDIFETLPSKIFYGQIVDRTAIHEENKMRPKESTLSIFSPTSNRASPRDNSLNQEGWKSPFSILENSQVCSPNVLIKDRQRQRRSQVFKRVQQPLSHQTTTRAIALIHDKSHSLYKDEVIQKRSEAGTRSNKKSVHLQNLLKKHAVFRKFSLRSKFYDVGLSALIDQRRDIIDKVVLKFREKFSWLKVVGGLFSRLVEIIRTPVKPDDAFHFVWDIILMLFILHDLIVIPFNVSFPVFLEGEHFTNVFDNVETFFFLFDIALNFRTAFYKDGNLTMDFKSISRNYLKGWFWIDLVSSFPFIWIAQLISATSTNSIASFKATKLLRVVRVFKFTKVLRVIRIIKLKQILSKIEDLMYFHTVINAILSLVRLSIFIFFLAHWCACFWYLLGASSTEDNWLGKSGLESASFKDQYITSLYFSITTMLTVGYGDITPRNINERLFTIFMMLMGGGVFGYVMNSIATIAQSIEGEKTKMRRQMYIMSRFMQRRGLTKAVQSKVKKYMELIHENEDGINKEEAEILDQLSGNLREEIFKQINGKFLNQAKIFSDNFHSKLLSALSLILEEKTFYPQEVIFGPGSTDYAVYFVSKGTTGLFYEHFDHPIEVHKRGDYFGEVSFFGGHPEPVIARSVNFSHIIYLKRNDFMVMSEKYEHDKELFHMIQDKINLYEDYTSLNTVCQICDQRRHLSYKCPRVHYILDREAVIRNHILERKKFDRAFTRRSRREANVLGNLSKLQDNVERIRSDFASVILNEGASNSRHFKYTHGDLSEVDTHQATSLALMKRGFTSKASMHNATFHDLIFLEEENPGKYAVMIARNQPRSFRDLDLEDKEEFDRAKNYQIYFTHNNLAKLIEKAMQDRQIKASGLNIRREVGETEYLKSSLGGFFQKMVLVRKSVEIRGDIWKLETKQR